MGQLFSFKGREMRIRGYEERDRSACRSICAATTFGITEDTDMKTLYTADCDYYLDNAADTSIVAVNDGDEAIGYLLCERSYKDYSARCKRVYWKKIMVCPAVFTRKLVELWLYRRAAKDNYSAHLRIGVMAAGQRMGVGSALMDALVAKLRAEGVTGVSAVCAEHNAKGNGFYKKYGFTEKKRFLGYVLYVLETGAEKT